MHYLAAVYFVTQPLNVSNIFVAHHQGVNSIHIYIYMYIYIYKSSTNCCIYTVYLLMMGYKYARNM